MPERGKGTIEVGREAGRTRTDGWRPTDVRAYYSIVMCTSCTSMHARLSGCHHSEHANGS